MTKPPKSAYETVVDGKWYAMPTQFDLAAKCAMLTSGPTEHANALPALTPAIVGATAVAEPNLTSEIIARRSKRWRGSNTQELNKAAGIPDGFLACPICEEVKPDSQYYKTRGRPCGYCRSCHAIKTKAWREQNRDKSRTIDRRRRERKLDERRERCRAWHAKNRDQIATKRKVWASKNKALIYANNAKRRALELRAAVAWANQAEIKRLYRAADLMTLATGVPYHVDHVVPLKSPVVCGLHCEANLQVITAEQNCKKRNRLINV